MSPTAHSVIRIGTRKSKLALAQTEEVCRLLRQAHPELAEQGRLEMVPVSTSGDRITDRLLADAGGKGLFIKELDEALLSGEIDMAVHSMKDMESFIVSGLLVASVFEREDARDVFVSARHGSLEVLPKGAVVGTASVRRKSAIAS